MKISPVLITSFQKEILAWYDKNKRDLPWRSVPFDKLTARRDPYKILISEIMLQQTQVSRVIPKYEAWLKKFPTVHALAQASTADVLTYWSGLGYNRRALNLKKTAEQVVDKYGGEFPSNETELLRLPGIGKYTARALLSFAFEKQVAVVDTNVRKVIVTRILRHEQHNKLADSTFHSQIEVTEKEIEDIADQLLPHGQAYDWNQALMDYSREVLRKEKITIPKQSPFIGSRRYYRGTIIKLLIEKKEIAEKHLIHAIQQIDSSKEDTWIKELLEELIKEKFIQKSGEKISLAQ